MDDIEIVILPEDNLPYKTPPLVQSFRKWGQPEMANVKVICSQKVFSAIEIHSRQDRREVGGLLLGVAYRYQGSIYIEISAYIPAKNKGNGQSSPLHFEFTSEIQAEMWRTKDRDYDHLQIVGWFHSHPDIGIFLSPGMDMRIQEERFNLPWQTAMIYDPVRHEGGFFVWQKSEIIPAPGFYEHVNEEDDQVGQLSWRNLQKHEEFHVDKNNLTFENLKKENSYQHQKAVWACIILLIIGMLILGAGELIIMKRLTGFDQKIVATIDDNNVNLETKISNLGVKYQAANATNSAQIDKLSTQSAELQLQISTIQIIVGPTATITGTPNVTPATLSSPTIIFTATP